MLEVIRKPRSDIPAVTHIDYSARVQTIEREDHKNFYDHRNFYDHKNFSDHKNVFMIMKTFMIIKMFL